MLQDRLRQKSWEVIGKIQCIVFVSNFQFFSYLQLQSMFCMVPTWLMYQLKKIFLLHGTCTINWVGSKEKSCLLNWFCIHLLLKSTTKCLSLTLVGHKHFGMLRNFDVPVTVFNWGIYFFCRKIVMLLKRHLISWMKLVGPRDGVLSQMSHVGWSVSITSVKFWEVVLKTLATSTNPCILVSE